MCQLVILAYNAMVPESDTVVADLVKVNHSKSLSVEWRNSKGKYKEQLTWKNALSVILFSKNGSPFSVRIQELENLLCKFLLATLLRGLKGEKKGIFISCLTFCCLKSL